MWIYVTLSVSIIISLGSAVTSRPSYFEREGLNPFFQSMLRSWSTILEANAAKMVKTTVPTDPKLSLS